MSFPKVTVYLSANKLRYDSQGQESLFDSDAGTVAELFPSDKTYAVMQYSDLLGATAPKNGAAPIVIDTNERTLFLGHLCRHYIVKLYEPITPKELARYDILSTDDFGKLSTNWPMFVTGSRAAATIPGVPLKLTRMTKTTVTITAVTSIETDKLSSDVFKIPTAYKFVKNY